MTRKELLENLNEIDRRCIDEGLHFYDLKSLYESNEKQLTQQQKKDLQDFINKNPNAKPSDIANLATGMQVQNDPDTKKKLEGLDDEEVEEYKVRYYVTSGPDKGKLDHEEFFDNKESAIAAYKEVFDRNLFSLNPTVWKNENGQWRRILNSNLIEGPRDKRLGESVVGNAKNWLIDKEGKSPKEAEKIINSSSPEEIEKIALKYTKSGKKKSKSLKESVEEPYFRAFVTNLGKYNEGELVGDWVDFPIDEDKFDEFLKSIGIGDSDDFGAPYEEWFVSDYECNLPGFNWEDLGEYPSFESLQKYGEMVQSIDDVEAVSNAMEVTGDLQSAIDGLSDGRIIFFRGIETYEDLAYRMIDEMWGGIENLDRSTIENYFDYESLGRELDFDTYEDSDGNDVSAGEFFCGDENATDKEIGEAFVEEVGFDGVGNIEYYFDYEDFGRDLSFDGFTLTSDGCILEESLKKKSIKRWLTEGMYDSVIADLESIEKFLRDEGFTNYDVYGYDSYPMETSKIDFEISGDWKHDHLVFKELIQEWAQKNGRNIFKIDTEEQPSDSDYYTAVHSVYITKDDDALNKLNSMRALFADDEEDYYDESLKEDWTHFSFKSGANPYIAKTEKEANRIIKKYGKKNVKEMKPGFYEVDDKNVARGTNLFNEASYGGAYDIEDDMFFTKEEIVEFVDDIIDELSAEFGKNYFIEEVGFDDPANLYISIEDTGGYSHHHTFHIDMRRIKLPKDIYKYKDFVVDVFKSKFGDDYEYEQLVSESINEDTVRKNGKWVNKGKEGTHGEFKTKKAADAQRKAMFANGYTESFGDDIPDKKRLTNEDKRFYIDELSTAEDREDLEDIVHEIFFYDKGLFSMLRHFPKDMPFEELRDKLIEIIQSTILDEGLQDTVDDFSVARATWDSYDTGVSLDDALEEYNDFYGEEDFYAKPIYNEEAWNQMKSMFMESLVRNKKLNENLMDAVLDRADGVEYNPEEFYRYLRDFGYRWYNDILREMDSGEEDDVADAIVDSVRFLISSDGGDPDNQYAQQLYQFIRGSTWLTNDKTAERPQYLKDIENEQNSDYDYSKDLDGVLPDDELEEDYQSSDDGWGDPYTFDEVERELKKITNGWKDKDGTIRCYYEQEKEFGKQILKKHYKYVEVSDGRTGPGEKMSWVLAYSSPKSTNESFGSRAVNLPAYAVSYVTGYGGNGTNRTDVKYFRTKEEQEAFKKKLEGKNAVGIKAYKVDNFYHTFPDE